MTITITPTDPKGLDLEPGTYAATVKAVDSANGVFGSQVKLIFAVDGQTAEDGSALELWGWASRKLNSKTKLWGWVTAITGTKPVKDQPFEVESLIGASCRLQVAEVQTDDGPRIRVTDVLAPSKRPPGARAEDDPRCRECFAPLGADGYFSAKGEPYCVTHGPRGSGFA